MDPIATYREVRFDGKRLFRLHADRLEIEGRTFLVSEFQTSIPLITVAPGLTILRVRPRNSIGVAAFTAIAALAATILIKDFGFFWDDKPVVLSLLLTLVGLALMAATWKKVEFHRFATVMGHVAFDIARSGPDAASFDAFLTMVKRQIDVARDTAGGRQPSHTAAAVLAMVKRQTDIARDQAGDGPPLPMADAKRSAGGADGDAGQLELPS
jgi:hypothetical protein